MDPALIKAILAIGIQLLSGVVIPWLTGLIGGPLGWLAGLALKYLVGMLEDMADRYLRFADIDAKIKEALVEVKSAATSLKAAQNNPGTTEAEREKALKDFSAAARKLGRFRL